MCVTGAWGDSTYKNITTDTKIFPTSYDDLRSAITEGWISTTSDNFTIKGATINPQTGEAYESATNIASKVVKASNDKKEIKFYVTNVTAIKVFGASSGSSSRRVKVTIKPSDNSGATTAYGTASAQNVSQVIDMNLVPTKSYEIDITGVQESSDSGEDCAFHGIWFTAASTSAPTITTQPASATYLVNGTPSDLTVAATASSGDLSYQWYKNTDQDKTAKESDKIAEATSSTLAAANISTSSTGTTYYYVVVKDGQGSTTSNLAAIEVVNGVAPEVGATISSPVVRAGTEVTLTANVNAGVPAPTLQWYTCNSDGTGEESIDGATNNKYVFTPENVGSSYYKVKASNASGYAYSDVKSLNVIAQGVAGGVGDLETITSNYTFIADNHTGSGTVGFTAGYLYDDSRIFSPKGNNNATNKGTSTIDGNTYFNSLRVKSADQDVLVFKVGGPCAITFYTENPGKSRTIKVGNAEDDDSYGTISDANEAHVVIIPAAGTVYMTGSGDRFIAGFKMEFTVSATIGSTGYTTFASSYPLDLSNLPEGITAYTASVVGESEVTFTPATTAVTAGTGLLLKGTINTSYDIPVVASGETISGNKMIGCPTATEITPSESYYVLVNNGGTAEFRPLSGNYTDNKVTIPAGKAYLDVNAGTARALSIALDNEEVTGINTIQSSGVKAQGCYNLNGQRVAQPAKGLYIINGRKVVVK